MDSVWSGTIADLPKAIRKNGEEITYLEYRVVETSVTVAEQKQTITIQDDGTTYGEVALSLIHIFPRRSCRSGPTRRASTPTAMMESFWSTAGWRPACIKGTATKIS